MADNLSNYKELVNQFENTVQEFANVNGIGKNLALTRLIREKPGFANLVTKIKNTPQEIKQAYNSEKQRGEGRRKSRSKRTRKTKKRKTRR